MDLERDATERIPRDENADWDRSLFIPKLYDTIMSEGTVPDNAANNSIEPLGQAVLATFLSHIQTGRPQGLRNDFLTANPIIGNVFRSAGDTLVTGWADVTWSPLDHFHLSVMDSRYDETVSTFLKRAGVASLFSRKEKEDGATTRSWLGALLFHPLQNAKQHGANPNGKSYGGVAIRIVRSISPAPLSVRQYQDYWSSAGTIERFLEVVIHDNGASIPNHFYKRRPGLNDPPLESLPVFNEWTLLQTAFERHQTSKPHMFRARTADKYSIPGVGLVGLLQAVKRLNAFMEIRTARLRGYRWYTRNEVIADSQLLRPIGVPEPAPSLGGTIFRMVVPLI
jgi:hypothetical protein